MCPEQGNPGVGEDMALDLERIMLLLQKRLNGMQEMKRLTGELLDQLQEMTRYPWTDSSDAGRRDGQD